VDELEEFARCIRTGAVPETGAREGLAALSVIEGVVETAASGGIRSIGGEEGERAEDRPRVVDAERG
jgi:predicted dehydrogenase